MVNCSLIPPEFVPDFYRKQAGHLPEGAEALDHFLNTGKEKGVMGSPACDQGYFVRLIGHMQPESVLEIGPGASPKLKGENVFYFDVKSEAELTDRYRKSGNENVPEQVHYVNKEGNLKVIDRKFGIVFSSHVVEHVNDLATHLTEVANLLNDDGLYFMVVPNKKYSFDYFKPTTTIEDVLIAHCQDQGGDGILARSVVLEKLRRAHNDPARHWRGDHGTPLETKEKNQRISGLLREFNAKRDNAIYRSGFHRWFFDEQSLTTVVNGLHDAGLSQLRVRGCYNTPKDSLSFNVILGR